MDEPVNLVGLFFHRTHNGRVSEQGHIVGYDPAAQLLIIEYLSWVTGDPTDMEVCSVYESRQWVLYRTADDMDAGLQRRGLAFPPTSDADEF